MSEANSNPSLPPERVIEVEPAAEGPPVKAKRQLTPAQLEALKRGREKLAEKRRAAKEDEDVKKSEEQAVPDAQEEQDEDDEILPDASGAQFCSVM